MILVGRRLWIPAQVVPQLALSSEAGLPALRLWALLSVVGIRQDKLEAGAHIIRRPQESHLWHTDAEPCGLGVSTEIVGKGTASPVECPGIVPSFLEMQGLCPISYVGKTGDLKSNAPLAHPPHSIKFLLRADLGDGWWEMSSCY